MMSTPFHTLMERRDDTPLTDAYDQAHGDPLTDETRYMCMVDWARSLERRLAASEAAVKRLYNESQQSKSDSREAKLERLLFKARAYVESRGGRLLEEIDAALASDVPKPGGDSEAARIARFQAALDEEIDP